MEMDALYSTDIDTFYDLWLAEQQASYFGFKPGCIDDEKDANETAKTIVISPPLT